MKVNLHRMVQLSVAMILGLNWSSAQAATLYWAGGTTDKAWGTSLPTTLDGYAGTWNSTLQNWAIDLSGTEYQAWDGVVNTRLDNVAVFAAAANSGNSVTANLAGGSIMNLNQMVFLGNVTNRGMTFHAASGTSTINFTGNNPTLAMLRQNADGGFMIFDNTIKLTGASGAGLTLTSNEGGNTNNWNFNGDESGLSGTLAIVNTAPASANKNVRLGIGSTGNIRNISTIDLTSLAANADSNSLDVTAATGANNQLSDTTVIKVTGGSTSLGGYLAYSSFASPTTPSTETIGQIQLRSYLRLDLSKSAAGSSGTNYGTLTLANGIDRGPDGKGTMQIFADTSGVLHTNLIVNGTSLPQNQVLPWITVSCSSNYTQGNPVYLNTNNQVTQQAVISANTDLSTWASTYNETTYLRYDSATAPTNSIGTMTLATLSLTPYNAVAVNFAIAAGSTVTLNQGLLYLYSGGSNKNLTGGTIKSNYTAPGGTHNELYLASNQNSAFLFNMSTVLADNGATPLDVIFSGGSTTTFNGTTPNTYTGTTYVTGGTLILNKNANVVSIPGDLVIEPTAQVNISAVGQIATTSHITIQNGGVLSMGGFLSQAFGGLVTINGGTLSCTSGSTSVFTFNGTGTGLAVNGGTLTQSIGRSDLLTNVSYASTSTTQALISGTVRLINGAGSATRTFDIADSATLAANISEMKITSNLTQLTGTAAIDKTGTGTLELTGLNTYSGGTIIDAGKLIAGNNTALGTGSVTVNAGGQLATAAGVTLSNTLTVNNGGYFGPQFLVNASGNYNTITSTINAGVVGNVGSTLALLDGTASAATTVSVLWRARTSVESNALPIWPGQPVPPNAFNLISDVVNFSGTGSDLYTLRLSYDPAQIVGGASLEGSLAAAQQIYLAYLDTGTGYYTNPGTNFLGVRAYNSAADFTLGNWGVDTTTHVAWAVVNHNSDWAVVPEPGTLALLAFGSMAVLNLRRNKNK